MSNPCLYQSEYNTYLLDLQEQSFSYKTCAYLIVGETLALVETGPAPSVNILLKNVRELGFNPQDITHMIITHIHLDHCGAVGHLAQLLPRAKVYIHHRVARHLIDPSRLITSARKAWGPLMDKFFGKVIPTPEAQVVGLANGDLLPLGKARTLKAIETPGHSRYHLCFLDVHTKELFAGDALGVCYPEVAEFLGRDFFRPVTPMPDFNLQQAISSIQMLAQQEVETILFTHYGIKKPAFPVFERAIGQLLLWQNLIHTAYGENPSREYIMARAKEYYAKQSGFDHPMVANHKPLISARRGMDISIEMSVDGFLNYLQQTNPALYKDSINLNKQ